MATKTKPTTTPPTLGEAIRAARTARGLTRMGLAELLHVWPGTVYCWETGRTAPPVVTIRQIAEALGVSLGDLVR